MSRSEKIIVSSVFCVLLIVLSWLQVIKWNDNQGDTAFLSQLTQNIMDSGASASSLGYSAIYFLKSGFLSSTVDQVKNFDLKLPPGKNFDYFTFHWYPILYLFALFRFVDVDILLPFFTVLSFMAMLLGA